MGSIQTEGVEDSQTVDARSDINALCSRLHTKRMCVDQVEGEKRKATPLEMMQKARDGLAILDKRGWNRSFHQRLFHEDFLVSRIVDRDPVVVVG